MLIDQQLPAPVGGVTQVPPQLRNPAQVTQALNTFPSLVHGLGVRSGTTIVAQNIDIPRPSVAHTIAWSPNRADRLLVSVSADGIRVANCQTGVSSSPVLKQHFPVNEFIGPIAMNTYSPFFFGDPATPTEFTSCVVGPDVYIAARGYSRAQWSGAMAPAAKSAVLVSIEDVTAGTIFGIRLIGINTFITAATPLGSTTRETVAESFRAALAASTDFTAEFSVVRSGASILIARLSATDTTPIDLTISDSTLGQAILLTHPTIMSADLLPTSGVSGFVVAVRGLERTTRDDYWVHWVDGVWTETAAPGTNIGIDAYIMPWVLKSVITDGEQGYQFGPVRWDNRDAGDDVSNPLPVLFPIDLLFTTEQRLGITSGATICFSATGKPHTLFRSTVSQLIASDPVGGTSAIGPESQYHSAVAWDNDLYLWSHGLQTKIEPNITPQSFALSIESRFENSATVPPIVIGSRVYYVRYVNGCTRVYEYWRPPGYNMPPTVTDITESIPTYLAGAPTKLAGDEALGFLCVFTDDQAGDRLYVCHFSRDGNGAIQPRWHTWNFLAANLHAIHMMADKLLLLLTRGGVTNLEALDVANPADTQRAIPTDVGGAFIIPSVLLEGFYPRDDKGTITQGRFTIRNMAVDHQHTRSAAMLNTTDGTALYTKHLDGLASSGQFRVPFMRLNTDLTLTFQWVGFLTGFHMQGSFSSRNKRL